MFMEYRAIYSDSLSHHGIIGQKWGVRRFQNADGTWTEAGKKRYGRQVHDTHDDVIKSDRYKKAEKELDKAYKDVKDYYSLPEKERDKYYEQAARNALKKYGFDPDDEEVYKQYFAGYKYDDLDVGPDASFSFYLKDKGIDPAEWSKKEYENSKKFSDEVKASVDDALKKLGPENYNAIKADAKQYESAVLDLVWDLRFEHTKNGIHYRYNPMDF